MSSNSSVADRCSSSSSSAENKFDHQPWDKQDEAEFMLGNEEVNTTPHRSHQKSRWTRTRRSLVWIIRICNLAVVAAALFVLFHKKSQALEQGDDLYGALPQLSHQQIAFRDRVDEFTPNYTSEAHSLEVLDRWRALIPKGSGNIQIGDLDQYRDDIPAPFKINGFGELYKVSWVHQMHCLYYVMSAYDVLVRLGPTGAESMPTHGEKHPHTRQCFDYLRQTLMCHVDMTLEGASGLGPPRGTDGYGSTHLCRNLDESIEWIESRRPFDDQDVLVN